MTAAPTAPAKVVTTPPPDKPRPPRDWSWRHGPIIGPVNAGAGLSAAAMVGDLAGVVGWWGAAAGVAAAAGATVRAHRQNISPLGLVYRAGCWATAGGWMSWALATSAWSPDVLAGLAAGALAAGLAAPEMAEHETRVVAQRRKAADVVAQAEAKAADDKRRIVIAEEWEARLTKASGFKGFAITAVQDWPDRGGYTLQVRLPGGVTRRMLAGLVDTLATDADLPLGCGAEIGPGTSRGVVLIRVSTVDTTAEAQLYPQDITPLTFTGPLPIGMHRASVPAVITLLEDPAMVVGRRGSGKTVTLQVINAGIARCIDALLWHIDLNGSGMSSPWLDDYLAGRVDRPPIDWVAATPDEALLMVRVAINIAKGRKVAYKALMKQVNDDKIPISATVPAIVIVLDEGAEAVAANRGNASLAAALEELISIARATREQIVLSGLRATSETIPTTLKKQVGIKIQMRPEELSEIAQLFEWNSGVAIEDAPYPGSGLLKSPETRGIAPYRGYDLRPADIRRIAAATGPMRPTLDATSARIGGTAYANRWARYRTWYTAQGGDTTAMPTTPQPDQPEPTQPQQNLGQGIAGLGGAKENLDNNLEKLRALRQQAENPEPASEQQPDFDAEFAAIVAGEEWDAPGTPAAADGRDSMVQILKAAGADGLHRDVLAEQLAKIGVTPSRPTLYRWLQAAEAEQIPDKAGWFRIIPSQ